MGVPLLVGLCFAVLVIEGGGVGLKRRLRDAAEAEAEAAGDAAAAEATATSSSSSKRLKGGLRQRLRAAEAEAESAAAAEATAASSSSSARPKAGEGPLWKGLIRRWATGNISALEVQKLAAESMGQQASGMGNMAKLGNFGGNPQNCQRALQHLLGLPHGAPAFKWATIPTARGANTLHPFLMPHDVSARTMLDSGPLGQVPSVVSPMLLRTSGKQWRLRVT